MALKIAIFFLVLIFALPIVAMAIKATVAIIAFLIPLAFLAFVVWVIWTIDGYLDLFHPNHKLIESTKELVEYLNSPVVKE